MEALKPRTWEEIDSRRFDPYSLFRRSDLSQTRPKIHFSVCELSNQNTFGFSRTTSANC